METITKTFTPEIKALGDRQIKFTISTAKLDRHGDTVNPTGWDTKNYEKNPVVLYAHNYDAPPIGRCLSLSKTSNGLVAVAEFATADLNPMGDSVYKMLKAGFLSATSVGFLPKDWNDTKTGRDYTSQELLEFSVVPVPANSDALAMTRSLKSAAPRRKSELISYEDAMRIVTAADAEYSRSHDPVDANTVRAIVARAIL
jgi:HK97 family phage prohead protease